MATFAPKKTSLYDTSAAMHTKADAEKVQAKIASAIPTDKGRKPFTAGNKSDSGKKSR